MQSNHATESQIGLPRATVEPRLGKPGIEDAADLLGPLELDKVAALGQVHALGVWDVVLESGEEVGRQGGLR